MIRFLQCIGVTFGLAVAFTHAPAVQGQEPRSTSTNANRLTYLDESDPFYPGLNFPRLTTPQWIGEAGVEAVVILSIDDMRDPARYEAFLRPILERLKQIDGRAPVSILVNAVAPTNAQLQTWLQEGLSLEIHTLAHPCPCLARGDFQAAANTYHGCVELMNQIPGNKPVAFRMPCCDSMNSPSPRFYAEIFNRTNGAGQFLTIDSSVMCIPTAADAALPRDLVLDADGRERFRKYLPTETNATTRVSMKSFVTTIENYPYPYVIDRLCWEFPPLLPSDWEAFNLHGSTNATTLADWKTALDVAVIKQGVFPLVFHPHGWSSPRQFIELIDYAVSKHGRKVKFLTFREAQERLDRNLLAGQPLRAADGQDNGVRLVDLNNDGYLDVVVGNARSRHTRLWAADAGRWIELEFPVPLVPSPNVDGRFAQLRPDGFATLCFHRKGEELARLEFWDFDGKGWRRNDDRLNGLSDSPASLAGTGATADPGLRFRDLDHDGRAELLIANQGGSAVLAWSEVARSWRKLPYHLPRGVTFVDAEGRDAGLRFVDVNGDGHDDLLFSNEKEFSLHLFVAKANQRLMFEVGWNDQVWAGRRGELDLDIPMIVRGGANRNNGVWFRDQTMWIQNEDTAHLPDKVDRRTFRQLLTADQPPGLSAEQSLAQMRVRPGFKVELVASEPLVQDPIAFEWGADGRLWVVEMGDYPVGLDGQGKPGGRIKFLEDLDGDARYDRATLFLEGANFPTGVMPWRHGVLVSAAPEIFYAEDTDGDGRADKRETLFSGFKEGNPQHRVNGFEYGLDNWVYGANGDSGGRIHSHRRSSHPDVSISGRDFRFRPDDGAFEAVAGMTQYGRHRDDWGNWFGNNNPTWLWHFHIPEHYLPRNPDLAVSATKRMLANRPDAGRLFPISRTRQRFNDHHHFNHVTSANSATPYRDDWFGPEFATSVFISDPVHNVVHREVLEPDGVSFTSRRAADEGNSEFLASADNWFRPITLKTGPDGALYIADMYRHVLEHPEWIPAFIQPRLDLRAGAGQGRIYRVVPQNAAPRRVPRLDQLDSAGLVGALDSVSGWQRDTAQRLLVHRQDPTTVPLLERLVKEARNPRVRLQALCTLDGMGATALSEGVLLAALADPHAAVREQAVRVAESAIAVSRQKPGASLGDLGRALLARTDDPDPRVRYQLAYTLGEWDDGEAGAALARIGLRESDNADLRLAVMSSAPRHLATMLEYIFTHTTNSETAVAMVEPLIGLAASAHKPQALARALTRLADQCSGAQASAGFAPLAALYEALVRRNQTVTQFGEAGGPELKNALSRLNLLFEPARATAFADGAEEGVRTAAVRLMGHATTGQGSDVERLGDLLSPQHSSAIQRAALAALVANGTSQAAGVLLARWKSYSPALRGEVLNALASRAAWARTLVAAVASGQVPPGQVGTTWQQRLLKHSDRTVAGEAAKVFSVVQPDRQALLKEYAGVTRMESDAGRGLSLFRQHCANCHRWRGEGIEVGPDLASLANKSAAAFLTALLDPNQAVEDRYVNYTATTRDDREFSGIITTETATSITLRAADGREETLLRVQLRELTSSGLSLMPEGFEKALKPQDVADLLAWLLPK